MYEKLYKFLRLVIGFVMLSVLSNVLVEEEVMMKLLILELVIEIVRMKIVVMVNSLVDWFIKVVYWRIEKEVLGMYLVLNSFDFV